MVDQQKGLDLFRKCAAYVNRVNPLFQQRPHLSTSLESVAREMCEYGNVQTTILTWACREPVVCCVCVVTFESVCDVDFRCQREQLGLLMLDNAQEVTIKFTSGDDLICPIFMFSNFKLPECICPRNFVVYISDQQRALHDVLEAILDMCTNMHYVSMIVCVGRDVLDDLRSVLVTEVTKIALVHRDEDPRLIYIDATSSRDVTISSSLSKILYG